MAGTIGIGQAESADYCHHTDIWPTCEVGQQHVVKCLCASSCSTLELRREETTILYLQADIVGNDVMECKQRPVGVRQGHRDNSDLSLIERVYAAIEGE